MAGETNLDTLLNTMRPKHHPGEFVFCTVDDINAVNINDVILLFKEAEGHTIIIEKKMADALQLHYSFVASWITLTVHSSLEAVGLTAAFSKLLAENGISCNVVAAFYHDHIFVNHRDVDLAMKVLKQFAK